LSNATTAGVFEVNDDASTNYLTFEPTKGGSMTYAGGVDCPAFELAKGKALVIKNATGVDTYGHITYVYME
jgi:hypothetical protein